MYLFNFATLGDFSSIGWEGMVEREYFFTLCDPEICRVLERKNQQPKLYPPLSFSGTAFPLFQKTVLNCTHKYCGPKKNSKTASLLLGRKGYLVFFTTFFFPLARRTRKVLSAMRDNFNHNQTNYSIEISSSEFEILFCFFLDWKLHRMFVESLSLGLLFRVSWRNFSRGGGLRRRRRKKKKKKGKENLPPGWLRRIVFWVGRGVAWLGRHSQKCFDSWG